MSGLWDGVDFSHTQLRIRSARGWRWFSWGGGVVINFILLSGARALINATQHKHLGVPPLLLLSVPPSTQFTNRGEKGHSISSRRALEGSFSGPSKTLSSNSSTLGESWESQLHKTPSHSELNPAAIVRVLFSAHSLRRLFCF